jgi:hypothetical protein
MTRATEVTSQSSCTHSPRREVLYSCAHLGHRWRTDNARSISSAWPLLVLPICWLTDSSSAKFCSEDPLRYLRNGYPALHRCVLDMFSSDKPFARLHTDYCMAVERPHSKLATIAGDLELDFGTWTHQRCRRLASGTTQGWLVGSWLRVAAREKASLVELQRKSRVNQ